MVIAEIFRNVAGHRNRLAALVTDASTSPDTWALPRFLDEAIAEDVANGDQANQIIYNTKMDSIRAKLGEVQILFNDIFALGGMPA